VVAVWGLQPGGLNPVATVFDSLGHAVPAEVLADAAGSSTLQVPDVRPNTTYVVRVSAADPHAAANRGDYFLGIDFRQQAITMQTFAANTLTAARPAVSAGMTVAQSELLHFALATVTADGAVPSAARLVVLDQNGQQVFTLFAAGGQTMSGDVLLGPGHYTLVVTGGTPDHSPLPDLGFTLTGLVRNDPIGIGPVDPSGDPSSPPNPPPPETTTTTPYTGPYTNPYK
jgi:hypothetical protein